MDDVDRKILEILQSDGRRSHESIASEVYLSRPAVRKRIRNMEEEGIISGYRAEINYTRLGFPIHVLIYLKVVNTTFQDAMDSLAGITDPDIICYTCYRISGEWCLLLKVMSRNQEGLTRYLDRILSLEGITAANTVFLFKS